MQISIGAGYMVYICQFSSFYILRRDYPTLKKEFVNPLGKAAAYVGIAMFCPCLVGSMVFQEVPYVTPAVCFVYILLCSAYYWLYSRHKQVVSSEEEVSEPPQHV